MPNADATLWEINIAARPGRPDADHVRVASELAGLEHLVRQRFQSPLPVFDTERGYILDGPIGPDAARRLAHDLLADTVVETATVQPLGTAADSPETVTVLKKPGVMDPVAASAAAAIGQLGCRVDQVRTFRRYRFAPATPRPLLEFLAERVLANQAIEQVTFGPLAAEHLGQGAPYEFLKLTVPLRGASDEELARVSTQGQLYLNLVEMRAIRDHFERLGRDPTDVELETIAQTWSEHCSHKTFRGPYRHNGVPGTGGLLKDTIMRVTRTLDRDWCVSVFVDNAGVVKFDENWNVCFKVETHNHPSAIEPYGGANTGIGGVIRDPMGTGLGAKPICNTDVFCVASPQTPHEDLPEGVLHPGRVLRGVVAGVRDYGNRMGIPTVNGAVCFDDRYLGNPLVYCGTVGLLPADKSFGGAAPGDLIVAIGGRTGRDGIHGATFSSGELTAESETLSSGAVQIGNAITEKQVLDVLLRARDAGLYRAVTDCGAGGFSSAVGEMGAGIGARVELDRAPLKYAGLSYTEIWISEAQERMVLAVPQENWEQLRLLAAGEGVEATVLGRFEPTGRLTLYYGDTIVGELSMHFLHEGRPPILRTGKLTPHPARPLQFPAGVDLDPGHILRALLASPNICSKEWIIRQYDHEVKGGTVVKPLTGVQDDGPSDAAVICPILGSARGLAIGCGINPRYGDLDPYRMAASVIDEAIRNVVAVGGDPAYTALLDNFCWGNTEREEVFGSLCEAAFACRDVALAYGTPFISGKDSLNNEFLRQGTGARAGGVGATAGGTAGPNERIVIPPTLLISAMAIVPDVTRSVTMDLKQAGNAIYVVGWTADELGGSHFQLVTGATPGGGQVPRVDTDLGKRIFAAMHATISAGLVRACHDASEGGLAVALAEMAFAGGLGASVDAARIPRVDDLSDLALLFSESNSRFLVEVAPAATPAFEKLLGTVPFARLGEVRDSGELTVTGRGGKVLLSEPIAELKAIWKAPLAW